MIFIILLGHVKAHDNKQASHENPKSHDESWIVIC